MSVIGTNTHAPTQVVAGDVAALAAALTGRVVQPGDADWDAVRTPWNLAVDQRPALVVQPENADDIVAVVTFARRNGLRVVPQGTGHHAGAVGDIAGTVLLRTDRLREVTVTPESRTVRVGAGVLWAEVSEALAPYGLTARAGSSGDVGVVGYTLGGGHSWLGRRHGLAASAVTAVELVTGDGVFHRVDADTEPELFWGVRGGGGSLGVVSALEFTALPDRRGVRRRPAVPDGPGGRGLRRLRAAHPRRRRVGDHLRADCYDCRRCRRSRRCCGARRSRRSTASSTHPSRSRSGCSSRCARSDLSSTCSG